MALGKIFTVKNVVDTVLLWLREEMQGDLEPNLVKNFANLAVMEEAEKIAAVNTDDYGKTASVTESAANVTTTIVTGVNYTDINKTITSPGHGLTTSDVGKRIIVQAGSPPTRIGIGEIASITDTDNFVLKDAFGLTVIDSTLTYAILSQHASLTIDLSGYKIMNIVKLYSTVHKEVKKLGDIEADNIERNDFKASKVYWYKHGETIFLVIPAGQTAGALTLFYNSYPEKKTSDTDYFDIRDNYIPQVIRRTKQYCLEHLGITPPESLTNIIEQTSEINKKNDMDRRAAIEAENIKGLSG